MAHSSVLMIVSYEQLWGDSVNILFLNILIIGVAVILMAPSFYGFVFREERGEENDNRVLTI